MSRSITKSVAEGKNTIRGFIAGLVLLFPLIYLIIIEISDVTMRSQYLTQQMTADLSRSLPATVLLGDQIKASWPLQGSFSLEGSNGTASLEVPVAGSLHAATAYVEATRTAGHWQIDTLSLRSADQTVYVEGETRP